MALTTNTILEILIVFILLFFTVLLFHVGRHTRSNRYLGYYFICQILPLFNLVFHPFPGISYFFVQSIIFAWGAFYYLFVSSLLDNRFKFEKKFLLHFIPYPIGFFLLLVDYYQPVNQFFQTNAPFFSSYSRLMHKILFNGPIIGYNIATVLKYYRFRKDLIKGQHLKSQVHPLWLNISIWGFIVSCFCNQIGYYLNVVMPRAGFDWTGIGLIAFLLYFCVMFYVAVSSRTLLERTEIKEKYKKSKLPETEALLLLSALEECMISKRLFTNQELKLKDLAEQLNTSERNLSQIVNTYKNQNFSDYINSYRIQYAQKLLADQSLQDKTILWILFEAGFNSKATFNTLFKKVAGCTPAEYRKRHSS
jgi:AraC-like DNA-binding protein